MSDMNPFYWSRGCREHDDPVVIAMACGALGVSAQRLHYFGTRSSDTGDMFHIFTADRRQRAVRVYVASSGDIFPIVCELPNVG